jgi:hypothetical protein
MTSPWRRIVARDIRLVERQVTEYRTRQPLVDGCPAREEEMNLVFND